MTSYNCNLCDKIFNKKNDLTKHLKMCNVNNNDNNKLITIFKSCLNILRDNEGLTGDKALRNLSYLLILKLIEPHLNNEINIDNYNYDFSHVNNDLIDMHKNKLLEIVRFSNLSKEPEVNLLTYIKFLWNDILSVHPSTKNIFLKDKSVDIEYGSTYKKIIDKINSIDLTINDYDILGNAYEEVIQDIMTGKVLGQFFTQPLVKKIMVNLIKPKIFDDGKIETCCDPTMGTGGFLITYLQYILEQAKIKNINPDWNFIINEGLYGKELDHDTYQLAVSNMLISSGHMFENLERGDTIREPIIRKFDNILANPPFGIKGLKYNSFNYLLKNEYLPIKSDNAVSLFIQAIIYMLKINGRCAIVLPDGQDLFSKTNKTLISIREYLMKTCELKEIIYLPAGIFNYTSIKTCIFYFIKKKEGTEILEITYTKKDDKIYKFSDTHETKNIKFYDYVDDEKKLLVKVPIEKIIENKYSLNYSEYIEEEKEEQNNDITIKSLGDICNFLPKSKRPASYGKKEGLYPFFKSSINVDSFVDEPDYNEESLIIGDGGEPNINYGTHFSTSDHCYILQNKNKLLINLKYVYYYLFHNLNTLKQLYTGIGIKNISKTNIINIKIPILSLEKQNEIINNLDLLCEKNKQLEKEIINNKLLAKENIINITKSSNCL
jgi:type I restriction-modification system DNA methylase subunit